MGALSSPSLPWGVTKVSQVALGVASEGAVWGRGSGRKK